MTKRQIKQKAVEIADQIVEKYRPEKIILFGSAAWGNFTADSDMDFLIIKSDVPERGIDRQYMVDKLIDRRGVALDFLVYKPEEVEERMRLGDPFIKEIISKGKVLHG